MDYKELPKWYLKFITHILFRSVSDISYECQMSSLRPHSAVSSQRLCGSYAQSYEHSLRVGQRLGPVTSRSLGVLPLSICPGRVIFVSRFAGSVMFAPPSIDGIDVLGNVGPVSLSRRCSRRFVSSRGVSGGISRRYVTTAKSKHTNCRLSAHSIWPGSLVRWFAGSLVSWFAGSLVRRTS